MYPKTTTSRNIIFKHSFNDTKIIDYKFNSSFQNSDNQFAQFVQESNDTIYFLASAEHPMNLTLNIFEEIQQAQFACILEITILKSTVDFKHRLQLIFNNTNLVYYLAKEPELFYFLGNYLNNNNFRIVSIKKLQNRSLSVIVGSEFAFSNETFRFVNSTCLKENDDAEINLFKSNIQLNLNNCPKMFIFNEDSLFKPIENTVNLNIILEKRKQIISGSFGKLTTELSIYLLAFVCLILNLYQIKL